MTFADALLRVKSDYMPELALETHTNERLYRMLGDAATEIAASYGFLRYTYELDVAKLSSAVGLPDYSNYRARDILRVERASLGGRQLRPAPREVARLDAGYLAAVPGYPRYFYWRSEEPELVRFNPRTPKDAKLILDTVHQFPRNLSNNPNNQIWNGQYEAFQDLVVMKAAARAFEAAFEPEEAQMIGQRLDSRAQVFTLHLQKMDVADIPVGGQ